MAIFDGVPAPLAKALEQRGYSELTSVQSAILAPALAGADLLVSAQTGSGKTVAFGIAIAPTLLEGERFGPAGTPLALAIAPTRELALQVSRELEWLYADTGAVVASCVGGMDMRSEKRVLERGAHIVVGTPGRLRDHIQRRSLELSDIRAVVLDEADEMLDLGFREDLEFILDAAPAERRTLMFSATVPRSIATLAKNYQRDAVRVAAGGEREQHVDIEYRALAVAASNKENAIINVLRYYEAPNAIVFCSTRAAVTHLTARFSNRGFSVVALSGELSQNERTHALQAMRDGRARVCVATDVAARGIDLPNLGLVIHADLPTNPDTLLHRSGRTGRAGRKGISVLIVPHSARRRTERLLQSARIGAEWASAPTFEEVRRRDDDRLMANPLLSDAISDGESELVQRLLEGYSAEQLASAVVRLSREGKSAPEDIAGEPPPGDFARSEPKKGRDREFGPSVWFAVSVGRKQNAEARWLLPALCRGGGITKSAIGAIRIQPDQTFVEISAGAAEGFQTAIGKSGSLERGIRVTRVDGEPDLQPQNWAEKPERKPHRKGPSTFRDERSSHAPAARQAEGDAAKPKFERPFVDQGWKKKDKFQKAAGPANAAPPRKRKKPKRDG